MQTNEAKFKRRERSSVIEGVAGAWDELQQAIQTLQSPCEEEADKEGGGKLRRHERDTTTPGQIVPVAGITLGPVQDRNDETDAPDPIR